MTALAATWRGAWAEALANRRGFWSQIVIMVLNDAVWIVFWVIFFRQVGTLRGWDVDDVLVLIAVATTSVGIAIGALANCRWIADLAGDGKLDAALSLPVPTLPYLLCRRVDPINVGDIGFGVALFAILGQPSPQRVAVFVLVTVCAAVTLTGFIVAIGSITFFTGPNDATDLGFQSILLFSLYPVDIFSGALKVVLYGVVPAALVASVPARLVAEFNPVTAALLVAASVAFAALGWTVFRLGLKRYTSGASWT